MSKIIVVTGKVKTFLLMPNGKEIQAFRPTVVSQSSFISNMFAQGKLKQASSCELKDDATDEAFEKVFKSAAIVKKAAGDVVKQEKLAVEEFVSKFGIDESADGDGLGGDTTDGGPDQTDNTK